MLHFPLECSDIPFIVYNSPWYQAFKTKFDTLSAGEKIQIATTDTPRVLKSVYLGRDLLTDKLYVEDEHKTAFIENTDLFHNWIIPHLTGRTSITQTSH